MNKPNRNPSQMDLWTGIIILSVCVFLAAVISIVNDGNGVRNTTTASVILTGIGVVVGGAFIVHAQRSAKRARAKALATPPNPHTRLG